MHRSRLCALMIDCEVPENRDSVAFWCAALGLNAGAPEEDDKRYTPLTGATGDLEFQVQRVEKDGGFHLDIETDDVDAEVARLEAQGARRIAARKTWWVMEAPSGQRFCVVEAYTKDFAARANVWES